MKNFRELSGILKALNESVSISYYEGYSHDLAEEVFLAFSKTRGDDVVVGFSVYLEANPYVYILDHVKYKGKNLLKFNSVKDAVDFINSFPEFDVGEELDDLSYVDDFDEIETNVFSGKSVKWDASIFGKDPAGGPKGFIGFFTEMDTAEWYVDVVPYHGAPGHLGRTEWGNFRDTIFSVHICRDDSKRNEPFTKEELEYIKRKMSSKVKSFNY